MLILREQRVASIWHCCAKRQASTIWIPQFFPQKGKKQESGRLIHFFRPGILPGFSGNVRFLLLKPMKLHRGDKNPSSWPVQPLGPFPHRVPFLQVEQPLMSHVWLLHWQVRSKQWGVSTEEYRSEAAIFFSLFKNLKTFPQSLVIKKNSKKQGMPQTLCQLQIFLA